VRRAARALLAFVIGFVGATAAVQALDRSEGDDAVEVGQPDFVVYCQTVFDERVTALAGIGGSTGWQCAGSINGIFQTRDVDVDEVCRSQFGADTTARALDPADSRSWRCFE
jgi:hypothetical protein